MKFTSPILLATLSIVTTLPSTSLIAEEQEPIIVTATRTAQTADETISPVIIIKRSELESNPNAAISDLLRSHAGIDIGRNGGPGQQTSIFIRGTESNHVLVMIDGVKINPATIGAPAIQNIDLNMIERIELVKGPRSTLYGSDAIGGVINIITRNGIEGSHYTVNAGYGSFNTKTLGFSANNKEGDRAAGITVNATKSDGYAIRTSSALKRGYDNLNIHLYGKKRLGETDLKVSHWQASGKTEYLNFSLNPVDQDYINSTTSLNIDNSFTNIWLSKIKLSRNVDEIKQNQSADYAYTNRDVLDWQNDIQLSESQLLTAGIYSSIEKTQASVYGTSFDKNTNINALFVQDDIDLGQHHVIAGYRYTHHDVFGSHNTGNVDYSWQLTPSTKLILGIASGFRSPDSTDLYSSSGNPNLLPEESENKEIAISYAINKQQTIRINHFQNDIKNLIEYDSGTSKMQNIAQARIKGTEIEYQYFTKQWAIRAGAIIQNPENKDTGIQLSRRSKETYTFSINLHEENYTVGMNILQTGERDNSAYDAVILKSYTLANINSTYHVGKNTLLNARIENVTDEKYELASTYRSPERSYYVGVEYNFE